MIRELYTYFGGLLLVFVLAYDLSAQAHFTMTDDIEDAYELAMSLRKSEALDMIESIKESDPHNLLIVHIENYIDFFDIFIKEEKSLFKQLEKNKNTRLRLLDDAKISSPYVKFVKAEITLQWALARLKFGEQFKAGRELYAAYHLLDDNVVDYPDFALNKKSLSIMHALGESLPGWVKKIIGVEGSIQLGTEEIKSLSTLSKSEVSVFYDEITTIYAYILLFQNNKKKQAWEMIKHRELSTTSNPLASFVKANIAQKNGLNDKAIDILANRPTDDKYEDFFYLDMLLGKSKLYKLEEGADKDILNFIENFKGEHFIKEAYQKLAWYELVMNNNFIKYKKYMSLCITEGNDLVDEDKQAKKEAKDKKIPNPDLLRARLLYDGGYYQRAYTHLVTKSYLFPADSPDYLEYNYRLGRISQSLLNLPDAIQYYGLVINLGTKSKSYYACNAALQIGLIFESQKRYKEALAYLDKCLDMDPDEYKSSLHQKAKSARERIREVSGT